MEEVVKLKLEKKIKKGSEEKIKASEVVGEEEQQYKFFVDLRNDRAELEMILKLLKEVNNKSYGRLIAFKDLAAYAVPKLSVKDLEKIQENSLSDMERVQKLLDEQNEKNKTSLTLGEFLVKKLNI